MMMCVASRQTVNVNGLKWKIHVSSDGCVHTCLLHTHNNRSKDDKCKWSGGEWSLPLHSAGLHRIQPCWPVRTKHLQRNPPQPPGPVSWCGHCAFIISCVSRTYFGLSISDVRKEEHDKQEQSNQACEVTRAFPVKRPPMHYDHAARIMIQGWQMQMVSRWVLATAPPVCWCHYFRTSRQSLLSPFS